MIFGQTNNEKYNDMYGERLKKIVGAFIFWFACWVGQANAALVIEITEGVEDAIPIAVVPFKVTGNNALPTDIAAVIEADLARSAQFNPLERKNMLAKPFKPRQIKFKNWRMLDIPNLVIGEIENKGNGNYFVKFRLYDVYRQKQIIGYGFPAKSNQLRKIAHKISDVIYEELMGVKGAFDTQIVYIKKFPNKDKKPYRLYLADADTYNEQEVMRHNWPLFSPTWSPDSKKLAFAMGGSRGPGIFIFDVMTGKPPKRLTKRSIKASAPAWSPDGTKMAMQVLENGSADIFVMDLKTKRMTRIAPHWAIDVEPTWAPDGKSIVFTSERGGSPQLYQYTFGQRKAKRLTFKGRQNLRASFSPDGKMITFVHLSENNGYNIAVMDLSTREMHIVADSSYGESEHESPSFAPNSSMIIYAANYPQAGKKGKKTGLVAVSVDGSVQQHFTDEGIGEVREPAWSSYLN